MPATTKPQTAKQISYKELGAKLKLKREEMGISLRDVSTGTSIRTTYLEAIEEGSAHHTISPAYARGFMKQYANFLGLDGERVLRLVAGGRGPMGHFDYGIGSIEKRSVERGSIKLVGERSSYVLIGAALIGFGYLLWHLTTRS